MDFIRWMFLIYCLSVGAYLTSLSGWWAPPYDVGMMTAAQGMDVSTVGDITPVTYVFGWEIVRSIFMIFGLLVLAPPYFFTFLDSFLPTWLALTLSAPMGVVFYVGLAQFIMRVRGGV